MAVIADGMAAVEALGVRLLQSSQPSKTTFYYWQKKLEFLRATASPSAAFVPVTLITEPMVELANGGVMIRVLLAASREQIVIWLAAVKSC